MSLVNYVPSKNRVYVRRFDHDEPRERFAAGESIAELAAAYEVSPSAVHKVVTPGEQERDVENSRRWRTTTCETCGAPAMRLVAGKKERNPDGRVLCAHCRNVERRERLRFDDNGALVAVRCNSLDCANGERWQPPENFPRGTRFRDVREGGIHGQCRSCLTRARQEYREKRKVPCATCGAPSLPPNEKTTRGYHEPRCRTCFHEQQTQNRRASAEAVSTHKERDSSGA